MPVGLPTIPETITVHLGDPDAPAPNVTLPFSEYILNVASSEIYPTWPEEAIRANIYAQISFALNRIYTEYYRSRGYDFDITNSTRYDQYLSTDERSFPTSARSARRSSTTTFAARATSPPSLPSIATAPPSPAPGSHNGGQFSWRAMASRPTRSYRTTTART